MTPETQAAAERVRDYLDAVDEAGDGTPTRIDYRVTGARPGEGPPGMRLRDLRTDDLRTLLAALDPAGTHHCQMCGERCYWQHCPTGGWWAHEVPSGGDHDAIPGQPCQPGEDDHCEPPAPDRAEPIADRHRPLTDQPCGVTTTPAGRRAVLDYRAIRQQQNPRGADQ